MGYGGGIWIFDVSEPASPVVAGMVATPDLVEDLVYHERVLYVANSCRGDGDRCERGRASRGGGEL